METVGTWQGVNFGKWVGKRGDWFFEQVKDRPVGGVPERLRQSLSCHAVTPDCPSPLDRQAPLAAQPLVTRIC